MMRALALLALVMLALVTAGCCLPCRHVPLPFPAASPQASPTVAPAPLPAGACALEVHFLDVGQGDAMLVKHGNRSMLVDGGPLWAGEEVSSYLKGQGVERIDVLVSTHPDADHIGGLLTVLEEFPVGVVYDSGIAHPTQTYEGYLTLIDRKDIPYRTPERGDAIDLGPGLAVQVISPPVGGVAGGGLNEQSIVLKITYGRTSFLLASDAGFDAEEDMLSSGYDLRSDVLKVGHHGSKYSSSAAFLKAVDPKVGVIEVGNNPYGHPAPEAIARLEALGSQVYRTDRDGHIVVASDGKGIMVAAQRRAPA
jgi:competence protein ComEC